jgi:subtilase family serine protease
MRPENVLAYIASGAVMVFFGLLGASPTAAQSTASPRPLITQKIDEGKLITLRGNTRPEAKAANDRGAIPYDFQMQHMLLQLQRAPELEQAFRQYIEELAKPGSPNHHKWLTAREIGERYGLAQSDLDAITGWLTSHGLTVNVVYPSRMAIDFSGTAGEVREAFRTEIHALDVNGVKHIANMSDPQIPAALAPAVVGVVSLNDFMPHPLYKMKPQYTFSYEGETLYAVVPADLATIYNLTPLFSSGISGQGQTVVVVEDTNVYAAADWATFRSTFGLSSFSLGSFSQGSPPPPSGTNNCIDPGVNGDDIEAILDAEYASAAAPSAQIDLESCSDTFTFGGLIAIQNLINSETPPAIFSVSYGECEAENGAAQNAMYNSVYQQAAGEGVSVFVASGDEGAVSCDADEANATHGIGVSGFTSTPYNVSVGGTDFGDTYAGTNSSYWNSTNTADYGSALSYVPEIPWNDSCASQLISSTLGFSTTYGTNGACNSSLVAEEGLLNTASGSGGPSGCATGSPSTSGVVSGTCEGYAKPLWQSILGNPSDSVRDIPDVSLFAANGVWSHLYLFCDSDVANGGTPCTGAPDGWVGGGGTSFASPIWAGFQALINQGAGGKQGNPNPILYSLASTEYGASGSTSCNSTLGNGAQNDCIFYDVTQGDMDVNCSGTHNCYDPSGAYGVLSTSNSAYQPAYGTGTGWDFATGIGTPNVSNLVAAWPSSATPDFILSVTPSALGLTQGTSGTYTVTISSLGGFSGGVTLSAAGVPENATGGFSINPATSTSVFTLTVSDTATLGPATITITGVSGSLTHSAIITVTVNAPTPDFSLSSSSGSVSVAKRQHGTNTITVTPLNGFTGTVNFTATGAPRDTILLFSPTSSATSSVLTITPKSFAELGMYTLTVTGTSGSLTHTTTINLTVEW